MTNKKLRMSDTHDAIIFVIEECNVADVTVGFDKIDGTYLLFDDHRVAKAVGKKMAADAPVGVQSVRGDRVFLISKE